MSPDEPPAPPLDVYVHVEAFPPRPEYRVVARAAEEFGWFHHAISYLAGSEAAAEQGRRTEAGLGIERVQFAGQQLLRMSIDRTTLYFTIDAASRSVWILHACRRGLFRSEAPAIAAAGMRLADARRSAGTRLRLIRTHKAKGR